MAFPPKKKMTPKRPVRPASPPMPLPLPPPGAGMGRGMGMGDTMPPAFKKKKAAKKGRRM